MELEQLMVFMDIVPVTMVFTVPAVIWVFMVTVPPMEPMVIAAEDMALLELVLQASECMAAVAAVWVPVFIPAVTGR